MNFLIFLIFPVYMGSAALAKPFLLDLPDVETVGAPRETIFTLSRGPQHPYNAKSEKEQIRQRIWKTTLYIYT